MSFSEGDTTAAPRGAVIRVDGSTAIGSGHVRRCLVLAEALAADGWRVAFACRYGTREVVPPLARSAFPYHGLPVGCDEPAFLRRLTPGGCALLVVDHYGLDARFERACRGWADRILVIDDLADRHHDCDVLVDQTPGRQAGDYAALVPAGCSILAGPHYAVLDPRFRREREASRPRSDDVRRILVSFGGTDPAGATVLALEALRQAALGAAVDVVLGTVGDDINRIRRLAAELDPPAEIHVAVDNMAALLARTDLAIGAGGVSALERCCVGVASIILTIADNQLANASGLAREGAAQVLGPASSVGAHDVALSVAQLARDRVGRAAMARAGQALCDGYGASRVAQSVKISTIVRNDDATKALL